MLPVVETQKGAADNDRSFSRCFWVSQITHQSEISCSPLANHPLCFVIDLSFTRIERTDGAFAVILAGCANCFALYLGDMPCGHLNEPFQSRGHWLL